MVDRRGLRGRTPRGARREVRPRRRDHAAPGAARVLAQHDRAPDRGPGPDAPSRAPVRQGDRARSGVVRARAHREGAGVARRGGRAARNLVRPVPAPVLRGRPHPDRGVRIPRVSRPSGRVGPPRVRPLHPHRSGRVHPLGPREQPAAPARLRSVRGRVPRHPPGPRHPQGVRAERRARAASRRAGGRDLPHHHVGARGQLPRPGDHRRRARGRRGGGARLRGVPGGRGGDVPRRAAGRADDGHRGVPAAARPPRPPPSGTGRHGGGRRGAEPPRRAPDRGLSRLRGPRAGRGAGPDGGVRGGRVHLSGRPPPRPSRPRFPDRGRGAGRVRRGERRREDVDRPPAASPLRSGRGVGAHRWARPPRSLRPRRPRPDRGRQPGHRPLPRHGGGQPSLRPARRVPRRARRGGAGGERARIHREAAGRLPDGGRRTRGAALRRAAPADRDRPGRSPRRSHPGARRGAERGGCGERGGHPGGARTPDGGPHQPHLRPPPVERHRSGPDPRPRRRAGRRVRPARGAHAPTGGLLPPDAGPGGGEPEARGRRARRSRRPPSRRGSGSPVRGGRAGQRDHPRGGPRGGSGRSASSSATSARGAGGSPSHSGSGSYGWPASSGSGC